MGADRPGAGHVGDVRGRGLALGIELVEPGTLKPAAALTAQAVFALWQLGGIAYPVRDNVVEITPALTIAEDEVDRAIDLLTAAIDAAASGQVSEEEVASFSGW